MVEDEETCDGECVIRYLARRAAQAVPGKGGADSGFLPEMGMLHVSGRTMAKPGPNGLSGVGGLVVTTRSKEQAGHHDAGQRTVLASC